MRIFIALAAITVLVLSASSLFSLHRPPPVFFFLVHFLSFVL
jgi:hypothetical protein